MSADRDTERGGKRGRNRSGKASRLLRGLRFLLILSLTLTTFHHLTAAHADAHGLVTEAAATVVATEAAELPGEQERHPAGGVCHAADSCPLFLSLSAVTVPAPTAEAAPPMPDAFAASVLLPPHRHPPKLPVKA